ncbi:Re/Si-specific NAD(P)(+) transhydrogenase subunit alpha [Mariprofundus sp. EBB-1]|uniref:Re/Si-specific NAD(P)(+) transhydrogenase subunit alpha n=1 Tax=Mariprofundus sp. EBB-1 TaxID=2650971 RepID=UPI000EF23F7B|nr:Re/Si-specific NAD(P)(+) transhydrogenase subunit alpha [Mariprofundus sp. EBB-1]RLL49189.1 Re/Si-specific NAD(P)(+) transhydrogenase subunit alpha [Mariprofundus sp. EBB-1]
MLIAVPAESQSKEKRVAATPDSVGRFIAAGCDVVVQKNAGTAASYPDAAYQAKGAKLVDSFAGVCADADLVLKVRALQADEIGALKKGAAIASLVAPFSNPLLQQYADAGITYFCMEMVPRISRAQSMDVLSSQANIAGYKSVLLAMEHYQRFFPMLMTAAGTVQPAKVLVMGAGVAGLQAIATARRLGASVEAFDVRAAAKEQVESLGAKFVEVAADADAEDAGGYAKEMDDDYKRRQSELIAAHAAKADIIITTALIPGRPAPVLITEEMVKTMKPGSVIVDMAVEMGGNCPISELDQVVEKHGVTLVGVVNIPALMATDASSLYARNLVNFITPMLDKESGALVINMDDEVVESSLICKDGAFLKPQLLNQGDAS